MMDDDSGLVAEYEQWLRSWGAAPKTIKARGNLARRRLADWGMSGLTPENITAWLGREGLSKWSKATYYANLKSFCEWLVATDRLQESPMDSSIVKKPAKPKSLPRPLSEPQVAQVLRAAEGRTRDWVLLALYSGLRAHEIAKLRGEDVAVDGIFVKGKGGVEAILPCHPELWKMAERYPPLGWWFPNDKGTDHVTADVVTMSVSRLFRSLGISGSIHRLRHNYGTRLLRSGANVRRVQQLMRHGTLHTTALYTAVDEDELRDAILLLPPPDDAA